MAPVVDSDSKSTPQRNVLIERQDRIEEYEDGEPDYKEAPDTKWTTDEYLDDDFAPDEEPTTRYEHRLANHGQGFEDDC